MKHRGTLTSLVVHGAIALVLVFVVKSPSSGAIQRFFTFFRPVEPAKPKKAKPPAPKKKVEPKKPPAKKKPAKPRRRVRRRVGRKVARASGSDRSKQPGAPVHDFGLVVDGTGVAPSNAVVLGAPNAHGRGDGSGAAAANTRQPPEAKRAKPSERGAPPCREALVPAKPIARDPIDYPMHSRQSGVQGKLVLELHIDERGRVRRVAVLHAVDPQLDKHVVASVRSWRFAPATRCGKPARSSYTISLRFELSGA